jgi:pimeloyl-ACP methyl ester carboxylesterase
MHIILVPGFWLNASAWEAVTPPLVAAGHTVHPLTLPGMGSIDADRSGITLEDHVAAVVDAIDALGPDATVVLVGHSGGGALIHAAADRRPGRIARNVYVDSLPLGDGLVVNDELPVVERRGPAARLVRLRRRRPRRPGRGAARPVPRHGGPDAGPGRL